ncbi:hydrolase [Streptococcus pneumoniae]|nr:hydrolase [Streptococcus pneumoniae]
MLGAIIGDIVGSVYEWNNIKTKDFPLFRKDCFFTDDTVMTCAVAEAIMNGGQKDDFIDAMKKYGRMYPNADYGARFNAWLNSDNRELIIALGMDQLCVFLHVLGSWTVVFMRKLVYGHHLEDLRVFLQR